MMLYAGNFDGSSCNHLGVARVIDAIDPTFASNATRVVWRDEHGTVAGWVKRRASATAHARAREAVDDDALDETAWRNLLQVCSRGLLIDSI